MRNGTPPLHTALPAVISAVVPGKRQKDLSKAGFDPEAYGTSPDSLSLPTTN